MAEVLDQTTDPQYLKIIVKALSDTLVKYILPQPVIDASDLLKSHVGSTIDNEEIMEDLTACLKEDESEDAELTLELRNVLHNLQSGSAADYIKPHPDREHDADKISTSLTVVLDGSYLKQFSKEDALKICLMMHERKLITERSWQNAWKKQNAYEVFLSLLNSIKQRKPDWPIDFSECLQNMQASSQTDQVKVSPTQMPEIAFRPAQVEDKKKSESLKDPVEQAAEILKVAPKLSSKFSTIDSEAIYKDLTEKEERKMTYFSDEDSDSDDDDAEQAETKDLLLREYQRELAKDALDGKNTIICAPTGSGKTRVATHIICEHLKKQEEKGLKKKVAFLARTVPLVMQQFKGLKQFLPSKYQMENVTGESEYSMSLHKFIERFDVFVMTPRILENHVTGENPLIPGGLAAFSLLVFDECHHTRKGEAYNTLMLSYIHTRKELSYDLPQVVGLTASIGVEKAKKVAEAEKSILKICSNLDAVRVSTVKKHEREMKSVVPVPKEETVRLKERGTDRTVGKILDIIKTLEERASRNIEEIRDTELEALLKKIPQDRKSQQYGQWVVMMEKKAMAIARKPELETNTSIRSVLIIADHLKAYNVALELYDLVQFRDVLDYLEKRFSRYKEREHHLTVAELAFYSLFNELKTLQREKKGPNKNLKELKKVIKDNLVPKPKEGVPDPKEEEAHGKKEKVSKGIIFVRTRFLAHALAKWMENIKDGELRALGTSVFTGTDAPEDDGGMTSTQQEEVIEKFMNGEIRLLVATSVAEEGLDIPECNLVIKYNHVGNEVTTVQMRGRSRSKGGKSVLLAFDSMYKKELINQYDAKMMEEAIKNVSNMSEADIRSENEKNQDEILKNDEIDKLVKKHDKAQLLDKEFKMVCKMCRQVVIKNQDIKLIDDSHHVVVNRELMDKVTKHRNQSLHVTGQMATFGNAICPGKPEEKAQCGNVLGSLMIYSKSPFIVLSVKSFGFETDGAQQLVFYNSWKKVPYRIQVIEKEDIQRNLPDHETSLDEISGVQQSQGNQQVTHGKLEGVSAQPAEDSVTDAKHIANSSTGESVTEAKTVAADEESAARDSGIASNIPHGRNETDQSLTQLKQASKPEVLSQLEHPFDAVPHADPSNGHLADTYVYKELHDAFDSPMSQISTLHLPRIPSESIQELESSLNPPEFSISTDNDDN